MGSSTPGRFPPSSGGKRREAKRHLSSGAFGKHRTGQPITGSLQRVVAFHIQPEHAGFIGGRHRKGAGALEGAQLAEGFVNLPFPLGHGAHLIPAEFGVDRGVLIDGRGIAGHGPVALGAVVMADAAAGDKGPGYSGGIIDGLAFHFSEHQAMIRHISHIKALAPGDVDFEAGLALHLIPSSAKMSLSLRGCLGRAGDTPITALERTYISSSCNSRTLF